MEKGQSGSNKAGTSIIRRPKLKRGYADVANTEEVASRAQEHSSSATVQSASCEGYGLCAFGMPGVVKEGIR